MVAPNPQRTKAEMTECISGIPNDLGPETGIGTRTFGPGNAINTSNKSSLFTINAGRT
jgi:hypothetical protein